MSHYVVELPAGLQLLVGVHDHPMDFQIVFPGDKRVEFCYTPGGKPDLKVHVATGLIENPKEEAPKRSVISSVPGGPTIKFADDVEGSRPMVP